MTTCPKCGAQFADGTKFCEACGAQIPEAEVVVNTTQNAQPQQNKAGKIPAKFIKLGAIAVIAVIAVIVLCSLIFSGGENNFALYLKDGELFYTDVPKFKAMEVTSDYVGSLTPTLSKDGTRLFYSDKDSGSLYFRYVNKPNKDAEKISSDVSEYEINEKANLVTYLKNYDSEKGYGDLYQHNLKEGNKIASDIREFWVSENGKKLLYVDDGNNLFVKNGNKEAEKIKGEINYVYYVSSDLSTVYYAADETLFYKKGNKEGQKIDSEVSRVLYIYETGEVFYAKENEKDEKSESDYSSFGETMYTLCYFDGKDKKEITEEFSTYSDYDYAVDAPILVYSVAEKDEEEGKTEYNFFLFADGESSEITTDDISSVYVSDDGKEALIIADTNDEGYGTLYKAKISGKKMKNPEKYDEDVRSASFVGEGNDILTRKDYNDEGEYTLYFNKNKVDDDIYSVRYNKEDDTLIYYTDVNDKYIGTMKVFNGKKSTKISDDIYVRSVLVTKEGDVLFLKDYNTDKNKGDLYIVNGKKIKKLDEDIQNMPTYSPDYDYFREMKYDCRVTVSLPALKGELEVAK